MADENALTIGQTVEELRKALREYIEATYHVSHRQIVQQRRALLERPGVISQEAFLESTPRYVAGEPFADLGLSAGATELLELMSRPTDDGGLGLLYNPPYVHQALSLSNAAVLGRSLVVTTGTGSGKTESFLMPILAKLADEAKERPKSFSMPAIRALVLYPMNALVNDQLGRLRLLLGNRGVVNQFIDWGGRPARFARYTSRTLYPGVRTREKDQDRLRPIERFYIDLLEQADQEGIQADSARHLITSLQERGKWPAKDDLRAWYGAKGARWKRNGEFVRATTLPRDSELFTRHEVLDAPPDVLVTNYSMLEYMLMRPLERPVFDRTAEWLNANPDERLVLVIDEAHLYRGAAGAEVSLLIRRLRARLGIPADRLQVICTSASFSDREAARQFGAALAGKNVAEFQVVEGTLDRRVDDSVGDKDDVAVLARVPLLDLYSENDDARRRAVVEFLRMRGIDHKESVEASLYDALHDYPPLGRLVNKTMGHAVSLSELATFVFGPESDAEMALTALVAFGSLARPSDGRPGLLPCRVHTFFRGLPGLWACLDPQCPDRGSDEVGPIGNLFGQPRQACECGSRVFEIFTCRNCGTAYARAYTNDLRDPQYLWSEPGAAFESATGRADELQPLDICLEEPISQKVSPAELDLVTGRLNPEALGDRTRLVFIPRDREPEHTDDDNEDENRRADELGTFKPCAVCNGTAGYGRSSVQDHQTKGDQPFQAVVTRQLEVQAPSPQPATAFAPLRGRKVLTFSDSRQMAARLAPNLETYAMRDVLRPLLILGLAELRRSSEIDRKLSLEDLYLAVAVAARLSDVRLRPKLKAGESMQLQRDVQRLQLTDGHPDPEELADIYEEAVRARAPESLLRGLLATLGDKWTGLRSLALGSVAARRRPLERLLSNLPSLNGFEGEAQRRALINLWIAQWAPDRIWFESMPAAWWLNEVKGHKSGKFAAVKRWLNEDEAVRRSFEADWVPALLDELCEQQDNTYRMRASRLTLDTNDGWSYCRVCKTTQRPFPGYQRCISCCRDDATEIDPATDPVFGARKNYLRQSTNRILAPDRVAPTVIVAAEHTAQLGEAQNNAVFSKAEEHELLFQDVDIDGVRGDLGRSAVDVLSCTTTMEVGIDIGSLSGVALRNMPPSRASYQQRAGRAGRRGSSVATVIAFGSADSHDEQFFRDPRPMISGEVDDPILTLDNTDIASRHITAFLLQRYLSERMPAIEPEAQPQLFAVLGSVDAFRDGSQVTNEADFANWIQASETALRAEIDDWLPREISGSHRETLLREFALNSIAAIASALNEEEGAEEGPQPDEAPPHDDATETAEVVEVQAEIGEERPNNGGTAENLLDRLLYRGVLPRYAFPTDVVSFHVFNSEESTIYRPRFEYAPSQGLPVALSQYAPGKEVWIDGKLWTSGAIYSPMRSDRYEAWQNLRLYFECSVCGFAKTEGMATAERNEMRDCEACGAEASFGRARNWIRPPGFAHPHRTPEGTSPDDQPARSYATRAKLVMSSPNDADWEVLNDRTKRTYQRTRLLVTNSGPNKEGYSYCLRCGLIEPTATPSGVLGSPHPKPYPDDREPECSGSSFTTGLVLGTDFISDVLLVSFRVDEPLTLRANYLGTQVALRTVAEALTIASTHQLEIESGELQAEFRPALTPLGREGLEVEIYLYDTLAGGAGFTREVGLQFEAVMRRALDLLEDCADGCDQSCYRCLRSFKNRFDHHLLDRFVGASLLRYVLDGEDPVVDVDRLERSTDKLFEDLQRHGRDDIELARNSRVEIPGLGEVVAPISVTSGGQTRIVAAHGPLTPDYVPDELLRDAIELSIVVPVQTVDELLIGQNLPAASLEVLDG